MVDRVVAECVDLIAGGLKRPESLVTHTVVLTNDYYGPGVHVWGDDDHPGVFNCEYISALKWVTVNESDEL